MKEEIIKKLYEEYRIKCLNEMFEVDSLKDEKLIEMMNQVIFFDRHNFSDRVMLDSVKEKINKKIESYLNGYYVKEFLEDTGRGFYYWFDKIKKRSVIYNFLGKKIYTCPKKVDIETTGNGYCIIKEKNFVRDEKNFSRLIDINGLTLLKAEKIEYIGNDIYAKIDGDRIMFVNSINEEKFFYREGVSSVKEIKEFYLPYSAMKLENKILKYCNHYYYYDDFPKDVLFDSSLRKIECDNYFRYLVYNERRECNINDFDIQEKFNGYLLKNKNIKLKYKPIYEYLYHIICGDEENYYLYNIKENKYYKLGFKDDIVFYDGLIINKLKHTSHYLDSENDDYIDVTSIFESKLKSAYKINYTKLKMLEYFEFKSLIENNPEYQKLIDKKIEEIKDKKEELLKKETIAKANKMANEEVINKDKNHEELVNELANLRKTLEKIEQLQIADENKSLKIKEKIVISEDMLLRTVGNHKVIDDNFKSILRTFNLININFANVDIRKIDFSYTNANINPQTIYNKDMSNCKFNEVVFSVFTDFKGVNIKGADFSGCSEFLNFTGAISDENTILPQKNKTI